MGSLPEKTTEENSEHEEKNKEETENTDFALLKTPNPIIVHRGSCLSSLLDEMRKGEDSGLDYLNKDKLPIKISAPLTLTNAVLIFTMEAIANGISKNAGHIRFSAILEEKPESYLTLLHLKISDDGTKKFTKKDLLAVLDYNHQSSSKRGLFTKRPGCRGNALKAVFALTFVLAEEARIEPPVITIISDGKKLPFTLSKNTLKDRIENNLPKDLEDVKDDGFTTIEVTFAKKYLSPYDTILIREQLQKMLSRIFLAAPWLTIDFEIFGKTETFKALTSNLKDQKEKTSALFYTEEQLQQLLIEFTKIKPNISFMTLVKEIFRDYATDAPFDNLQKYLKNTLDSKILENAKNLENNFLSNLSMDELYKADLLAPIVKTMKQLSKTIQKRAIVGYLLPYSVDAKSPDEISKIRKESILNFAEASGWTNSRYQMEAIQVLRCHSEREKHSFQDCNDPSHVEFPAILEVAVFDRPNDGKGLQIIEAVNYMPVSNFTTSLEGKLFARDYSIKNHLVKAGVNETTPLTLMVHVVTPVQSWLNEGKTEIDLPEVSKYLSKIMKQFLPLRKKPYRPKRISNFVPRGKIGKKKYEAALKSFANYLKSVQAELQKTRPKQKFGARSWAYFLEDGTHVSKDDFDAVEKAIGDARKLGEIPILGFIAEDQDETRRFSGLLNAVNPAQYLLGFKEEISSMLNALAELNTNFWDGETYFVMMLTEKGDIKRLFEPICKAYHVPIASTKGWSTVEIRAYVAQFAKLAEGRGQIPVLLLFYDLDPAGWKISETFRKNLKDCEKGNAYDPGTKEHPNLLIERFGLNPKEIDENDLTWIPNLKSSKGNEQNDPIYEALFGHRKCESNALFKNEETFQASEQICREAIEKYHGPKADIRFKKKEEATRQQYGDIYNAPIWNQFAKAIDELADLYRKKEPVIEMQGPRKLESIATIHKEGGKFCYGSCPHCGRRFDYNEKEDIGKVKVCRYCKRPMLLKLNEETE